MEDHSQCKRLENTTITCLVYCALVLPLNAHSTLIHPGRFAEVFRRGPALPSKTAFRTEPHETRCQLRLEDFVAVHVRIYSSTAAAAAHCSPYVGWASSAAAELCSRRKFFNNYIYTGAASLGCGGVAVSSPVANKLLYMCLCSRVSVGMSLRAGETTRRTIITTEDGAKEE